MTDREIKALFWRVANQLYFVLAAVGFPSASGLWAGGWNLSSTLVGYLCGIALCVLGGRALRREKGKGMTTSVLCLLLPMVLLVLLGQRGPVDCLVNLLLALLSVLMGYKLKR